MYKRQYLDSIRAALRGCKDLPRGAAELFLINGEESNSAYTLNKEEIMVLTKEGTVAPMSKISDFGIAPRTFRKYFVCYPKEIRGELAAG